jgi:hypothetical protein
MSAGRVEGETLPGGHYLAEELSDHVVVGTLAFVRQENR